MKVLGNLEPKRVMTYFEEISAIPRGSKNEKQLSNYLVKFAKDRGLDVLQDEALNVIIKKGAARGYEHVPTIIIQGHMDMVCEKNQDTVHDFEKEGIELKIDGDYIKAGGTTLGADNGVAVAFALALLDSQLPHSELEVVLTADEEMGMTGAQNLDPANLQGKILLNLDTEEEGEFYVSCAGGSRGLLKVPVKKVLRKDGATTCKIKIRGLVGGHSGSDIHKQNGNSAKLLGRFLKELSKSLEFSLIQICGGAKSNAIPRESDALIAVNKEDLEKLKECIENYNLIFKEEYRMSDPGVSLNFEKIDEEHEKVMDNESTKRVLDAILLHPNGIKTMSMDIPGLVESSLNLGVVKTEGNIVILESAIRSSVESIRTLIELELEVLAENLSSNFNTGVYYPAWKYRPESKIREICKDVYIKLTGAEPEIKAIHAGLECGIFSEKLGEKIDMISFGPNIYGAHTPEERVSISSIKNVWNYFVKLMEDIKNYY